MISRKAEDVPVQVLSDIIMPEVDSAFEHLVGLFYSMGQCMSTGMGLVSISWQELRAFRLENKLGLTLWERDALKQMSDAYCREYSQASDPQRQPPYMPTDEQDAEEIAIQAAMRMMAQTRVFKKER